MSEGKKLWRMWTKEEDKQLIQYRQKDKMKWSKFGTTMHKSETACRLRYQNYIEKHWSWDEEQNTNFLKLYSR